MKQILHDMGPLFSTGCLGNVIIFFSSEHLKHLNSTCKRCPKKTSDDSDWGKEIVKIRLYRFERLVSCECSECLTISFKWICKMIFWNFPVFQPKSLSDIFFGTPFMSYKFTESVVFWCMVSKNSDRFLIIFPVWMHWGTCTLNFYAN